MGCARWKGAVRYSPSGLEPASRRRTEGLAAVWESRLARRQPDVPPGGGLVGGVMGRGVGEWTSDDDEVVCL
jgi:hypothetical protein